MNNVLSLHKRVRMLHLLGISMLLTPPLLSNRSGVSAVTATPCPCQFTSVLVTLQITNTPHSYLVVAVLEAIGAHAAEVSNVAVLAAINDTAFRKLGATSRYCRVR